MSKKTKRALHSISRSIKYNAPQIKEKLAQVGAKPDLALVFSAAKYYKALKKLAQA